jgi:tetratricopeptide (TPR) repeat protein
MPSSIIKINQIDLLKYARMLFRYQFDNRSLKSIEANVLKFQRSEEEIPGYLAPIIYHEYLKTKNTESIEGVFYHNAMDIVSLAAFISIINQISAHQGNYFNDFETIHFSLAKQFERTKYHSEAINTYNLALQQSFLPKKLKINCYFSLAKMYKKFNQIDMAINFWQQASIYGSMEAHVELAKVYEHILKKYDVAINCCKRALFILENDVDLIHKDKLENEIIYRLSRLRMKAN